MSLTMQVPSQFGITETGFGQHMFNPSSLKTPMLNVANSARRAIISAENDLKDQMNENSKLQILLAGCNNPRDRQRLREAKKSYAQCAKFLKQLESMHAKVNSHEKSANFSGLADDVDALRALAARGNFRVRTGADTRAAIRGADESVAQLNKLAVGLQKEAFKDLGSDLNAAKLMRDGLRTHGRSVKAFDKAVRSVARYHKQLRELGNDPVNNLKKLESIARAHKLLGNVLMEKNPVVHEDYIRRNQANLEALNLVEDFLKEIRGAGALCREHMEERASNIKQIDRELVNAKVNLANLINERKAFVRKSRRGIRSPGVSSAVRKQELARIDKAIKETRAVIPAYEKGLRNMKKDLKKAVHFLNNLKKEEKWILDHNKDEEDVHKAERQLKMMKKRVSGRWGAIRKEYRKVLGTDFRVVEFDQLKTLQDEIKKKAPKIVKTHEKAGVPIGVRFRRGLNRMKRMKTRMRIAPRIRLSLKKPSGMKGVSLPNLSALLKAAKGKTRVPKTPAWVEKLSTKYKASRQQRRAGKQIKAWKKRNPNKALPTPPSGGRSRATAN